MKSKQWTLLKLVLSFLFGWGLLLVIFAPGRICEPVLSSKCVKQAWSFVGDTVWLVHLEKWQTLAAGLVALLSALVGAWFINRQIRLSETQERERWRRALASTRSILPLTLSSLMEYINNCSRDLKQLRDACVGDHLPVGAAVPEFEAAPLSVAVTLQKLVEVGDDSIGSYFSDALSALQVLDARIRGLNTAEERAAANALYIEELIWNVCRLHALASCAFDFARRTSENVGSSNEIADQYRPSLRLMGFVEDHYERLFQTVDRRAQHLRDNGND